MNICSLVLIKIPMGLWRLGNTGCKKDERKNDRILTPDLSSLLGHRYCRGLFQALLELHTAEVTNDN